MRNKKFESLDAEQQIRILSRRSFIQAGFVVAGGALGWTWLITRKPNNGTLWPFRKTLEFNENLARKYYSNGRLTPTFPRAMAKEPKPNGTDGLDAELDATAWSLSVVGVFGHSDPITLTMADIKKLPHTEMVTELKCIEGWSQIVHWGGVKFSDFAAKYLPITRSGAQPDLPGKPDDLAEYVGLATPDKEYYVGLDMASALHPQTLLCYEMNGEPLSDEHGAPLRLVIPVKYGIKHIKRIGTITYSNQRPPDFWAERGYDWYSGH